MTSQSIEKNTTLDWPGIPPRWTSSAKSCIGTSLNNNSRVWFTVSPGVLNEIYYPRVDQAEQIVSLVPTSLGTFLADLPTARLPKGMIVSFSFRNLDSKQWEDITFQVMVN